MARRAGRGVAIARSLLRTQLPLLLLAAIPTLLLLKFGGYHVRHGGWVALALGIWACVEAARGRLSAARSVAGVATIAFVALLAWTIASITWVDVSRHDAWVEAVRVAGYAAAFVLGGALLATARSFARCVVYLAIGAAAFAVVTVGRMALADEPLRLFVAGRLDWPVGYAPGIAALYLMGALLLLGVSCATERSWALTRDARSQAASACALAGAGVCASLAFLAQSRGTLPAIAVALVVALLATPDRVSWLLRLGIVGVGLLAVRGPLGAVYTAQYDLRQAPFVEGANPAALLEAAKESVHDAGFAIAAMALAVAIAGFVLAPLAVWLTAQVRAWQGRSSVSLAIPGVALLVAALVAGLALGGGGWAREQVDGCLNPPERVNDPGSATSYFANTGTGRCDYYRVALQNFGDHPLLGVGAGNFHGTYVLARETAEEPRYAHSLPLQLLGETGIVGGALGGVVLACVLLAAWRFARSGPGRDPAFAGAIALLAYWTTHASLDWLWQLPALTLPACILAGGLVACVSPGQRPVPRPLAISGAAGVALGLVALILPVTMADQALRRARDPELQERDPRAALVAARDAQEYDPTWAEPAITEASLQLAAGDRERAADAARRAVELEPKAWSVQYRSSGFIGLSDTQEGRDAFVAARRLNPQLPAVVEREESPRGDGPTPTPDSLQDPDA
ncbi:MAG: O-antigen polymerase [Thermoleophilia bacterium]|nr:O-antigen polymerase [Thermoleophilia bacterium]